VKDFWIDIAAALIGAAITTVIVFLIWKVVGSPNIGSTAFFVVVAAVSAGTDLLAKMTAKIKD
jgi:hypothetical protein